MGVAHYLPEPSLPEVPRRLRLGRPGSKNSEAELLPVPYYHVVFHPAGGDQRESRSTTKPPSTNSCSGPPPRR